jgi:release factor glutamine methyltransferase
MRTVDAVRTAAASVLRNAGIETSSLDARLLLCEATGLTHEALVARGNETIVPDAAERLSGYLARRLEGEPVSRIKGVREFYGRDFLIDSHTLDPRPDTETLVDAALDVVAHTGWADRPLNVLDLGTGSGCILLTLLAELPQAQGVGTDISEEALRIAGQNACRLGLDGRTSFAGADWFEGLTGQFDLIVSNPPYIASAEIAGLAREVAAHDPPTALNGGPDGLDAYRSIAASAADFLTPGGWLLVEIGAGQAKAVPALFHASGLVVEREGLRFDLAGRARCILAQGPF